LTGGTGFKENSFDLIYALSVFTHLSEPLQRFWITELTRIVRPGGHLFITLHGASYLPSLSAAEAVRFARGELVIRAARRVGRNDCAAFHPRSYVLDVLANGLTIVDHRPEGALGNPHQDVYLLRKPS
jgi:2-polyprenyl-3-methyl-5-hydroxy-6-metoxy-1,4-benzoquinol methylase